MAYGVDSLPSPPEAPAGHYEWDYDAELERSVRRWVRDEDPEMEVELCQ